MNWLKRLDLKIGTWLVHKLGVTETRSFNDPIGIKGKCHIVLTHPDGTTDERLIMNTVTQLMDAHVADQMSDGSEAAIGYMAIGTGTGQGSSDTGLATSLDRNALTSTTQGTSGDDNDVIYVGDWAAADGTGSITEAGLMRANNNTTMMLVASFGTVTKGGSDTLQITWTATHGAS